MHSREIQPTFILTLLLAQFKIILFVMSPARQPDNDQPPLERWVLAELRTQSWMEPAICAAICA
jgi:hypothetical protein